MASPNKVRMHDSRKLISLPRAKELLLYDPGVGVFIWKKNKGPVKAGSRAGKYNKYRGYRYIMVDRIIYSEHRLAWFFMTGKWPANEIDHINRIRDDNRWVNLRQATTSQNKRNSSSHKNSSSKYKGVSRKGNSKWQAQIYFDGRPIWLGAFKTEEAARDAYNSAAEKYFGAFAFKQFGM